MNILRRSSPSRLGCRHDIDDSSAESKIEKKKMKESKYIFKREIT